MISASLNEADVFINLGHEFEEIQSIKGINESKADISSNKECMVIERDVKTQVELFGFESSAHSY